MKLNFNLPAPTKNGQNPVWTGSGYNIDNTLQKILCYSENDNGWNEDLTKLHEELTGENHFIDHASRNHAIAQIKKNSLTQDPTILEIGCSSGFLLKTLRQSFPSATIIGSDVTYKPLIQLTEILPDVPLMRFDLTKCPLPDNCVDVVIALNVLEHIQDDNLAMQQIKRILKPGGIAIIEVPAGPNLYDAYDKALKHFRRYTLAQLKNLATDVDMKVVYNSHLGFFLYPGFWFVKKSNQQNIDKSERDLKSIVAKNITNTGNNKLLAFLMNIEMKLSKYISYPFGIRCLLTAKKL